MGFSPKQVRALRRSVPVNNIRTRHSNGRELSYVEGWYAIAEANRVFGFGGWDRETLETRCVHARENRGIFQVSYVAKVRLTVRANGETIVREGFGTGESQASSAGAAHEVALKGAETDATKRALVTFGQCFGLKLYSNGHGTSQQVLGSKSKGQPGRLADNRVQEPAPSYDITNAPLKTDPRSNAFLKALKDPESWPTAGSQVLLEFAAEGISDKWERTLIPPSETSEGSAQIAGHEPAFAPIDKALLKFGEPRRKRNRAHLAHVAAQPCLVCGREPSDAHHLRFAQLRALGRKASDQFTVPLCRIHHREVHHHGNESAWWQRVGIHPLEVARELWNGTVGNTVFERLGDGTSDRTPPSGDA